MFTKTSLMITIITPFMKHPMSMGFMLISQKILISMTISMKSSMTWYSYILFMTMIGGLMVMFMYTSSIASNEKFNLMPMKIITMNYNRNNINNNYKSPNNSNYANNSNE